jgi:DNA primase catalytic core
MAFPPRFLDELRERVSLVEIVARRVKLIRRGREFVGLCPFHNEKTPSFNVVEDKGFFHCFGCGAHGDAIGFLMQTESLSFREAVEELARRAGLEVPLETPEERQRQQQAVTLYDVCEAACLFFQSQLQGPSGKRGLDYLSRRGLDARAIERYRLGWAPDSRDALKRALGARFPEALLVTAGLVHKSERGDSYDFFRGRVVFPIFNRVGKTVGFGARTLGDDQPKYLNSPDTPIFNKGHTLYGLNWAREASKADSPPIVVEGYMDAISLQIAGFPKAIAPLGTALTEHQLSELWKLAPDPVICFDGDTAGQRAADRALSRALPLLTVDALLRFLILPEKEDPDSFVRTRGRAAFEEAVAFAFTISDFLWIQACERKNELSFNTPEKLIRLAARFDVRVKKINDPSTRREYRNFLYEKMDALRRRLRQLRIREKKGDRETERVPASLNVGVDTRRRHIEASLIAIAILRPEIPFSDLESLTRIDFESRTNNEIWQVILQEISEETRAEGAEPDGQKLRQAVNDHYLGEELDHILTSSFVQLNRPKLQANGTSAHEFWEQAVKKSHLAKLREQFEEAVERWMRTNTADDATTVEMFREMVSDCESENPYVDANWEAMPSG